MANLNLCQFIGNLTKDPELKFLDSGAAVGRMSLAVNRQWKDKAGEMKKEVEFINLTMFGKTAEICEKYLSKGKPVYVSGRMRTRMWEKDGQKHYSTEIVVEQVQFLGSGQGGQNKQSSPQGESGQTSTDDAGYDGNEDVPF